MPAFDKKLSELKSAVLNKKFPIIIQGPTGFGKLEVLKKLLSKLSLEYLYLDITSIKEVNKPLKPLIFIIDAYSFEQLEKIRYKNNLIILGSFYIPAKNDKYTVINVNAPLITNRISRKFMNLIGTDFYHKMCDLSLFRFLGRIFNKKISGDKLALENDEILYDITSDDQYLKCDQTSKYHCKSLRYVDSESDDHNLIQSLDSNYFVSFNSNKVLEMIYYNLLEFVDEENLPVIYEYLSLCDTGNPNQLISFIECLRVNSRPKGRFVSYKNDKYKF